MIGAVCLLVLVRLVVSEPPEVVTLPSAHFSALPGAIVQADSSPWQAIDGVPVSLLIENDGDEDDRLLGGSTPVAESVGLRRAVLLHGQPAAVPIPEGITIPAESTLILEPGKSHLVLSGLRTALVQGETFPLTLRFEHGGQVTVIARVRRRVDAAGIAPLPAVSAGDLTIALASAPPAPES